MNPISQCSKQFSKLLSTNNVTLNTCGLPFNISIDIIKNETMACMAQSLGQEAETRSHGSSSRLEIKCIMYTGIAYLTSANWQV